MLFDAQFTKDNWAYYIWPEDADMGEKMTTKHSRGEASWPR